MFLINIKNIRYKIFFENIFFDSYNFLKILIFLYYILFISLIFFNNSKKN
jgi:hypothetical protein